MSTTYQSKEFMQDAPKPQFQEGTGLQHKMEPAPVFDTLADGSPYKTAGKLEGKKALITGADSGIGGATAFLFALEGADVTLHYLPGEEKDVEHLIQLIKQRAPKAQVFPDPADFTTKEACEKLIEEHMSYHKGLDILIINHGIQDVQAEFEEISDEQWLNTFDVNIHGHFRLTKAALKHMPKGGSIAFNASVNHFKGHPMLIDYTATKGAMVGFARALSNSIVGKRGIRVNVVAPGPIWTPLIVATMPKESQEKFGTSVPIGRPGQPIEVATCFVFLASPDSGYISGQILHPNGGTVLS